MKDAPLERNGRTWVGPNRNTVGLVALLAAMAYAGAGQTNAAAYLLGFLLAAMAAVSIAHAYANVRGVRLSAEPIRPVFAGENLRVSVAVTPDSPRPRFGLELRPSPSGRGALLERVSGEERAYAELEVPARGRGRWNTLRVELRSHFPLGFFTAWQRIQLSAPHLVYPRPAGSAPLPMGLQDARDAGASTHTEGEDFAGLRAYQTGESQRHIDWKAVARGQPLLTRQWVGTARETVVLNLGSAPGGELEAQLSQLARWVVLAEQRKLAYGLRLGSAEIAASAGEAHFHTCLRALALFENREGTS